MFLLPCFRYRCRPSLLLLYCRGSFQASICRRPCLLVCLFGCFQCQQLPPALCLLPGFQLPSFSASVPAAADPGRASSCRRGYAAGAGLPSLLPVCFQVSSRRRSGAAAGIFFYKFNLFLCRRGIFFFLDPVKLPGIEALYQTIYNYNIYKTIQDHFSSCLFLLPGQTIPLVNFFIAGNALFSRLPGISAKYF